MNKININKSVFIEIEREWTNFNFLGLGIFNNNLNFFSINKTLVMGVNCEFLRAFITKMINEGRIGESLSGNAKNFPHEICCEIESKNNQLDSQTIYLQPKGFVESQILKLIENNTISITNASFNKDLEIAELI